MELNELKESWQLLNEQLQKNEIVNRKVVKLLIGKRMLSARDRLIRANWVAILTLGVILLIVPLAAVRVTIRPEMFWLIYTLLPAVMLYALWSIHFVSKLDLASCTLVEIRRWVLRYKRLLRIELWCTPFLALGTFGAVFLIHHHYRSVQMMVFDGLMLLVAIVASCLAYVYVDKRSVKEIEQGLEELHEFEEL